MAAASYGVTTRAEGRARQRVLNIRVRPVAPETCSLADIRFCERARFYTAADALRAVAARDIQAEIYRL